MSIIVKLTSKTKNGLTPLIRLDGRDLFYKYGILYDKEYTVTPIKNSNIANIQKFVRENGDLEHYAIISVEQSIKYIYDEHYNKVLDENGNAKYRVVYNVHYYTINPTTKRLENDWRNMNEIAESKRYDDWFLISQKRFNEIENTIKTKHNSRKNYRTWKEKFWTDTYGYNKMYNLRKIYKERQAKAFNFKPLINNGKEMIQFYNQEIELINKQIELIINAIHSTKDIEVIQKLANDSSWNEPYPTLGYCEYEIHNAIRAIEKIKEEIELMVNGNIKDIDYFVKKYKSDTKNWFKTELKEININVLKNK